MKGKLIVPVTALALQFFVSFAAAAPSYPGGYASGFAGVTAPSDRNVDTLDFGAGTTFSDRVEFDPGFYIGGTGGYDFGYMRVEGEISYRNSDIDSITDKVDGFRFRNIDGEIEALAMMFNAFLDLHNGTPVTPYAGGGIGFASLRLSDTVGVDTRDGVQPVILYGGSSDTVFAYQAGAGLEIAFNDYYSLDLGYRYFATESGRFGDDFNSSTTLRYESHNALVGFRVKF